jgi:hypothetical protein
VLHDIPSKWYGKIESHRVSLEISSSLSEAIESENLLTEFFGRFCEENLVTLDDWCVDSSIPIELESFRDSIFEIIFYCLGSREEFGESRDFKF